jgi:hypothetical protein
MTSMPREESALIFASKSTLRAHQAEEQNQSIFRRSQRMRGGFWWVEQHRASASPKPETRQSNV